MNNKAGEDQSTVYEFSSFQHEPPNIFEVRSPIKPLPAQILTFRYDPLINETFSNVEETCRQPSDKFRSNSLLNVKPLNTSADSKSQSPNSNLKDLQDIEILKGFLYIRFKRNIEKVEEQSDSYYFLDLRKAIKRIAFGFSEACSRLVQTKIFEAVVIIVIVINTIALAMEDPNSQDDSSFSSIEDFFLYFYTSECLLKICGHGFILNKKSYLRDRWNLLDFIIVISAWVTKIGGSNIKISVLRMLRILRPLRSITSIKGIRNLFLALFKSFKPLMSAFIVLFFFVLIFAIAALQLWSGIFTQRCMNIHTGKIINNLCGIHMCPLGFVCADTLDNPNFGTTSFDNILISLIMIFQILTLEGWTQILQFAQRSFSYYSLFFYIPLVVIGANLIMNLSLAIITSSFIDAVHLKIEPKQRSLGLEFFSEENEDKGETTHFTHRSKEKNGPEHDYLSNNLSEPAEAVGEQGQERLERLRIMSIQSILVPGYRPNLPLEIEESQSSSWDDSCVVMNRPLDQFSEPSPKHTKRDIQIITSVDSKAKGSATASEAIFLQKFSPTKSEKPLISPDVNSNSKSTLRRIRTVISVKEDRHANSSRKFDDNCVAYIAESFRVKSSSAEDVIIKKAKVEVNSGYYFKYTQLLIEPDYHDIMEKYSVANYCQLKKRISRLYGWKRAYNMLIYKTADAIKKCREEDQATGMIIGHWSGCDVQDFSKQMRVPDFSTFNLWSNDWRVYIEKPRFLIKCFILHRYTMNLVTFAVIFNTICLSIDHYNISSSDAAILLYMNNFFTYFFAIELFIRFIAIGPVEYLRDKMNYFDTAVVLLSIIELSILSGGTSAFSAFRAIRVFRIFRVLRVVRLLRYMKSIASIVRAMSRSLSNFVYLLFLLALLLIIFSLLGMKIFGGQFNFDEGLPRGNFDSFHWSFVTTFQVLTTENWNDILTSALRSQAGPASSLFLIAWVILGNFIFLNLFLAILIESFNEDEFDETIDVNLSTEEKIFQRVKKKFSRTLKKLEEFESENSSAAEEFDYIPSAPTGVNETAFYNHVSHKSYFIFTKENPIRILCNSIVRDPRFDYIVMGLIIANSFKLVWDTYLLEIEDDRIEKKISDYFDYMFTSLFCMEFVIKSINQGFVGSKKSYINNNWNKLDFIIIIFSVIDIAITSVNIPIIKVFRLLRTLRPLKLISHNLSMKIVVIALIESMRAILNVLVVIIIIWLVFAILGVSLLSGKMHSCSNPAIELQVDCESSGFSWINTNSNFDNVFEAMVTLFIVMSQESWPNRMLEGVDARDIGISPSVNANPLMAYFYIAYFIIGNFFLVNLFTAVVFNRFTQAKKDQSSMAALILSKEQMLWSDLQKMILDSKPVLEASHAPRNVIRALFFHVVKSKAFEIAMMCVILFNMLIMALPYVGASDEYLKVLNNFNMALTIIFITEAVSKIIGLGFSLYFKNNWNKFDFFVVVTSVADLIMENVIGTSVKFLRSFPQLIRVIRVLRIARLMRLVKTLKSLQDIMMIIMFAMPALLNILSLLLLVFFIFAVLGSFLFHSVTTGMVIGEYFNFSNFGYSMVILWRISTGEDYQNIMYDCAAGLKTQGVYFYFIVFVTLIDFVILELFVSVIIQNYEEQTKNSDTALQIFSREIKRFRREWSIYSFTTQGVSVNRDQLIEFIKECGHALGIFNESPNRVESLKLIGSLDIKSVADRYYYHDVLFAVLKRKYGKKIYNKKESYSSKLLRIEEIKSKKKLDKLREKARQEPTGDLGESSSEMMFYKIIFLKNIFSKWKQYSKRKKSKNNISITPRFSDCDYPGENSLKSFS